jgi:hypothetical protein
VKRLNIAPVDLLALIGLAVLAIGVGAVFIPAAFIVVGASLLIYAVMASRGAP